MKRQKFFFAYASQPALIGETVDLCALQAKNSTSIELSVWKELEIAGNFLSTAVRSGIDSSEILIADVSVLNFNVYYEIGYAIGRGKGILLVRHSAIRQSDDERELGLLDTLGYLPYENSADLLRCIETSEAGHPLEPNQDALRVKSPVFLLESRVKTDTALRIRSRVKKARLPFRSFDPAEEPRLSALSAIRETSRSAGLVLPLLPTAFEGARAHNLRAAFLAGLGEGLSRIVLLLQEGDHDPVPLDYRDFVTRFKHPDAINDAVADFASRIMEAIVADKSLPPKARADLLARLNLGSTAAENEMPYLAGYFVQTDAYLRALRGEVRLVVGRKGSGKTALFSQLRDSVRQNRANVVLDLRPEGYKLRKFKEDVLSLLQEGTLEHTVTAFWEYLLLLEVCYKLLEKDRQVHLHDSRLYQPYRDLSDAYEEEELVREGDFSERLSMLLASISQGHAALFGSSREQRLTNAQVTELLHKHDINRLRNSVDRYLQFKNALWILVDNLDKGWPTHGLEPHDLLILRTLLDATRRIQNDLQTRGRDAHTIVFLRRDVYELLVSETPDRGKESKVSVDWTGADLLRELVRKRLEYNQIPGEQDFTTLWSHVCVPIVDGEESSEFIISRSLMRPRSLLALLSKCWGRAVNLKHDKIQAEDISSGLKEYSSDLIYEIGLEIRDVLGEGDDCFYCFIGARSCLGEQELSNLLSQLYSLETSTKILRLLLWFGALGISNRQSDPKFIWDYSYDEKLLRAWQERWREGNLLTYHLNLAFWPALDIIA